MGWIAREPLQQQNLQVIQIGSVTFAANLLQEILKKAFPSSCSLCAFQKNVEDVRDPENLFSVGFAGRLS
jgi:hypothetical protein